MSILVTGAAGFLGQELTAALLEADADTNLVLTDITKPNIPHSKSAESRVTCLAADLSSLEAYESLLSTPFSACYLLHGIMSGGAEANLELGLRVNLDSFRLLLDQLRMTQPGIKVVFPSSLAVYGPCRPGQVVTESTLPQPQNSYGAQKLMVETLINDYSRRGLLDGRIVRLPTVIVRPGAPSAAASSFASGIVREPLKGENTVLPVEEDLEMWVCSPKTVIRNLIHARSIPKNRFVLSRTVNLPGITVKVGEILEALEAVAGAEKRALVGKEIDPKVEDIVAKWPARFDVALATELGFFADGSLIQTVKDFADKYFSS